jgi:hypothetical protein
MALHIQTKTVLPPFKAIPMRPPTVEVRRRAVRPLGAMHRSFARPLAPPFIEGNQITDKAYTHWDRGGLPVEALYANPLPPGAIGFQ